YFPMAIMDGTLISSMRTAANNGLAAKYLAKKDSEIVGFIGAGVLSKTILLALKEVLPQMKKVKIYDLSKERSQHFEKEMKEYDWVAKGTLYLHVGGNEAEFNVIHSADRVIVDDWEKIKSRGGATTAFMYAKRLFDVQDIDAHLGEIVNGVKQGRASDQEFIY